MTNAGISGPINAPIPKKTCDKFMKSPSFFTFISRTIELIWDSIKPPLKPIIENTIIKNR